MRPPPEIEKGGPSYKAAQDELTSRSPNSIPPTLYRRDPISASIRPLRLVRDDELRARVLGKAARQVREQPATLPLWAFRLAQHVNQGTYGYCEVWALIEQAATDAGANAAWADRCLYAGFADAMTTTAPPMPLSVLRGGVQ